MVYKPKRSRTDDELLKQIAEMYEMFGNEAPTDPYADIPYNRPGGAGYKDKVMKDPSFVTPSEGRRPADRNPKKRPKPQKVAPQVVFRPKPKQKSNPGDSLDALFNSLMSSMGGDSPSIDYETALAESQEAIRDAYRNDIEAIRTGNRGARKQTARERRDLEQMYNALSKDYQKMGARQGKMSENLGNRMEARSRGSANFLQKESRELLNEQAARAKGLGIEDAFAGATEGVMDETQDQVRRVVREGADDANRQRGFGGNNRRFMERGSIGAKLEGTNRSADLLENLQNFILQNRQKIAGLRGDRSRELAANESNVMSSVAEMEQSADAEMWDRLMSMAGLKLDIDKEQFDQKSTLAKMRQQAMSGGDEDNSMPGLSNVANAQHYLNRLNKPGMGNKIFDQILQSDEFLTGQQEHSKQMYSMTPYKAAQMVEEAASQYNLNPRDVELLRLAIMAQMG